ncbi:cysteine desulfurase family protein [Fodinicurvata fenggangensis]|uniref:cysteine desulfurase family protein n=1 Tax=Fodinicurvata fenggangensis TaxID=1121830 RepID=UPI000478F04D|nr:cysteine desulfurase family protein [Fodinicurvata fenggangensis]
MSIAPLYLDYNATAPMRPEALEAFCSAAEQTGNASSVHAFGRAARKLVEESRRCIARCIEADPAQVIFVSCGTEANATALGSIINGQKADNLIVSSVEHPSVLQAIPETTRTVPVDSSGHLSPATLRETLEDVPEGARVSIMLANNETGILQPISEIADVVHAKGGLLHCDAVQALGKLPLSFSQLGADMISLSAHKLGGPQGVGALVLRKGLHLEAYLRGGGQEGRRRAGTENVAGIAAFAAAVEAAVAELSQFQSLENAHRKMEERLRNAAPEAVVFGTESERLPNTSCVAMPGVSAELQLMALDLEGLAVSSGSACSSGKVEPSHVLTAMGADKTLAANALRISSGWASSPSDLERFSQAWIDIYRRQQRAA